MSGMVFAPSSWSSDGAYLAGSLEQARGGSGVPGVVVYSCATGRYQRLTDTGGIPVWLHDGRTLLYLQEGKVFECDLRSKASRLLLTPQPNSMFTSSSTIMELTNTQRCAHGWRSGLDTSSFRFTPTDSRHNGSHAVTVAVRARSSRAALAAERAGSIADGPGECRCEEVGPECRERRACDEHGVG